MKVEWKTLRKYREQLTPSRAPRECRVALSRGEPSESLCPLSRSRTKSNVRRTKMIAIDTVSLSAQNNPYRWKNLNKFPLPCSRHRKHWLVSCRGSVRCRSTAGAKRAASKHGSRETFQSDRQACIRHGSWVPKAPAGWTPCSQRAAHAAVRASWAHSLALRSRTRRGLRARGAAQHTGGATGRGQARGAASDLVCHLPPHARAQGRAVRLQRKRGAALLELGPAREHPLAAQRSHRERARHVAIRGAACGEPGAQGGRCEGNGGRWREMEGDGGRWPARPTRRARRAGGGMCAGDGACARVVLERRGAYSASLCARSSSSSQPWLRFSALSSL